MSDSLFCQWEKYATEMYEIYYKDCEGKNWCTDTEDGRTPLNKTYKYCPTCGKPPMQKNQIIKKDRFD